VQEVRVPPAATRAGARVVAHGRDRYSLGVLRSPAIAKDEVDRRPGAERRGDDRTRPCQDAPSGAPPLKVSVGCCR
jgi:hypothetical protein